jgi:hypothetical protein
MFDEEELRDFAGGIDHFVRRLAEEGIQLEPWQADFFRRMFGDVAAGYDPLARFTLAIEVSERTARRLQRMRPSAQALVARRVREIVDAIAGELSDA